MAREKDALPTDGSACNDAPGGRQDDSHVVQPEALIRDPHEDEEVITMRSTPAEVIAHRVAVEGVCGPCGGHFEPSTDARARARIQIVDVRREAGRSRPGPPRSTNDRRTELCVMHPRSAVVIPRDAKATGVSR